MTKLEPPVPPAASLSFYKKAINWYYQYVNWTAIATCVIAVATIYSVVVAIKTWRTLGDQLGEMKAARRMTMIQLRANIRPVNDGWTPRKVKVGNVDAWQITPRFENAGPTDAINVTHLWHPVKMDTQNGHPPASNIKCKLQFLTDLKNRSTMVLSAGKTFAEGSQNILVADAAAAQNGKKLILLVGRIDYQDVFFPESAAHYLEWCVEISPTDDPKTWSFVDLKWQTDPPQSNH